MLENRFYIHDSNIQRFYIEMKDLFYFSCYEKMSYDYIVSRTLNALSKHITLCIMHSTLCVWHSVLNQSIQNKRQFTFCDLCRPYYFLN